MIQLFEKSGKSIIKIEILYLKAKEHQIKIEV